MIKPILAFSLLLSTSTSSAASIQVLDDCNEPLAYASRYTILDRGRNTLDGWSHIEKAKRNGEYQSLALEDIDYEISQQNYKSDKTCDGEKTQNAILVVKLSDWTRQHSNGIETILDQKNISFGELTHVMMDIRVNRANTHILNKQGLIKRYKSHLTSEQFDRFDQGKVNLGITLFEDGALDQSTESFNLEYFAEIDQELYFDKWVRVLLPLSEFHAYTEKAYQGVTRQLDNFLKTNVSGFRINPENSHGKQLRNLIGDQWSSEIPETFKEMSISLSRIELLAIK